jgi:hypothetical protein
VKRDWRTPPLQDPVDEPDNKSGKGKIGDNDPKEGIQAETLDPENGYESEEDHRDQGIEYAHPINS